jgi:uncharacterized membrane-anchored protein YjiN (DUF445 family)
LIATDYFTKWKEARALKKEDTGELISFVEENILSRFGVPEKFITGNGTIFIGSKFTSFCGEYGITREIIKLLSINGLVEWTNKTLVQILKKIILKNQRNWHNKMNNAF